MLTIKFYPESDRQEFIQAAKDYQDIWNKEAERILEVMEEISGLRFAEKFINALIFEGISNARPLRLRASYPREIKKAVLVHELCHRLLLGNNIQIAVKGVAAKMLERHKRIYLILYDIYKSLYGEQFAKRTIEKESSLNPIYEKAWKWALSFSKEERAKKFAELIKNKLLS